MKPYSQEALPVRRADGTPTTTRRCTASTFRAACRWPHSDDYGKLALAGVAGYVHSRNLDTGDNLYHMMPLNAKLALEHKLGNWSSVAELQLVDAKTDIEKVRNELQTPGYALVNLRSSYQWHQFRFDLGVENLFDQQYYSPLGGVYLGDGALVNPGLERDSRRGHGPYRLRRHYREVLNKSPGGKAACPRGFSSHYKSLLK